MEIGAAILLTLCIFVFIPLIIGTAIGGVMVAADRRNRISNITGAVSESIPHKDIKV